MAIIAAIITAVIVWKSANLPIKRQDKREDAQRRQKRIYILSLLSADLQILAERTRQAEATIRVVIAANAVVTDDIRKKVLLTLGDWVHREDRIALLPAKVFKEILHLYRTIDSHNFDMARAGGAFGDENFRRSILDRTGRQIPTLVQGLVGQLNALNT